MINEYRFLCERLRKDFKKDFDYDIICHEYSCIHVWESKEAK